MSPEPLADRAEQEAVRAALEKRASGGRLSRAETNLVRRWEARREREARERALSSCPQADLARLLATTRRQVARWTAYGMPRNPDKTYDLAGALPWLLDHLKKIHKAEAERRDTPQDEKNRVQAERQRFELDRDRGRYVEAETVQRERTARIQEVTLALAALGRKLPPLLHGREPRDMQAVVDEEVRNIQLRFSRGAEEGA